MPQTSLLVPAPGPLYVLFPQPRMPLHQIFKWLPLACHLGLAQMSLSL